MRNCTTLGKRWKEAVLEKDFYPMEDIPFFACIFVRLMYSLISSASLVYKLTSDAQLLWHIILHCVIPPPANASGPSSLKNQKQQFVRNWEKKKTPTNPPHFKPTIETFILY